MEKDATVPVLLIMFAFAVVFYLIGHADGYYAGCVDTLKYFGSAEPYPTASQCKSLKEMVSK